MADVTVHLLRNLARYEREGNLDKAAKIQARLDELESPDEPGDESPSMLNTKAELLDVADAAGIEADETMTKAEILEALEND